MSVPANIVEGREQKSEAAFARYLRIAMGSASELEYHLLAARDIGESQVTEVRMVLHGLIRRLGSNDAPPRASSAVFPSTAQPNRPRS